MRVISSMFFSAASFYLLAILVCVVGNLAKSEGVWNSEGVWGGGSTLIRVPAILEVMLYFGPIWAAVVGIPSGAAISLLWNWTTRATLNHFLTSAFIALGLVALMIADIYRVTLEIPQFPATEWAVMGEVVVISLIIFAANAISISLTKRFDSAFLHS